MTSQAKGSILIVEDHAAWRAIYRDLFGALDYHVTLATNYTEAAKLLDSGLFELAIVDPHIPESSESTDELATTQRSLRGLQVVQALRAKKPPPQVIISTGYEGLVKQDPLFHRLMEDNQIYSVLEKGPQSINELRDIVNALESGKQHEAQLSLTDTQAQLLREIEENVESAVALVRSQTLWERRTRSVTDLAEITRAFKAVLNEIVQVTGAGVAHVLVPDGEKLRIVVDTGHDENRAISIADSVTGRAFRTLEVQHVPDTRLDPDYQRVRGNMEMRSEMAVPLLDSQRRVLGVLNVERERTGPFSHEEQQMLTLCARLIAILFLREDRSVADWKDLHPLIQAIIEQSPSLETILDEVLKRGLHRTDAHVGFVALLEKKELVVWVATDPKSKGQRLPIGRSLVGQVIEGHALLNVENLDLPRYEKFVRLAIERDHKSMLAFPIVIAKKARGVLVLLSPDEGAFDAREQDLVSIVADIAAIGIRQYESLKKEREETERDASGEVVHRLNNPIGAIRAWVDTIERKHSVIINEHPDLKKAFGFIRSEAESSMDIVRELRQKSEGQLST